MKSLKNYAVVEFPLVGQNSVSILTRKDFPEPTDLI